MNMTIRRIGLPIIGALWILHAPFAYAHGHAEACARISTYSEGPDTYRRVTNECSHNLRIRSRYVDTFNNNVCLAEAIKILQTSGNFTQHNVTHGGRLCIEYQNATTQTNSGYAVCPSVPDCGDGPHGIGSVPQFTYGALIKNDGRIVMTPSGGLEFDEGGSSVFDVHLSAAPASNVTVTLTKTNSGVSLDKTTLTFTKTNYASKQRVRVSSGDDDDHQDLSDTITLSAAGGIDADDVTKPVSVVDTDTGGFDFTAATIVLREGDNANVGNSRTVTIRIATAPDPGSSTAKISVTSSDTGAMTVSPGELTFSRQAWGVAGSVTLKWVPDADGTDESVDLTIAAVSGYSGVAAATKTITVRDDDGEITVSSQAVEITEGGSAGNFTVRLGAPPKTSAVLSVSSGDTGAVTVSPSTLTFSSSNWNSPQTVSVTGVQDNDEANESVNVTIAATSGYRASSASKSVSVTDDDARIEVSSEAVSITEGGSTGSFTVALTAAPSSNVTVSVSSGDTGAVTVSPSSIDFTPTDYDAETVTVTAVGDADGTDESVTITLDATSSIPDETKSITVEDDDGDIEASAAAVEITEGGSAGSFTVTLGAPPKTSATVSVSSQDTGAVTVSPATLTFNTTDKPHDTAQTVTVTPVSDSDGLDESATITLSVSGSGYRASDETKTIVVKDDDRGIELSSADVSVTEGGAAGSFTVVLETAPAADATVSVSSGDTGAVTVSPATLTFSSTNYDTAQTVTVTPVSDGDGLDETVTVTIEGSANYEVDDVTKSVGVVDDDRSIEPSVATVSITEGGAAGSFTVALETAPAAAATVSVSSGDTGAMTVSPATLTFSSTNYDTAQTVTVTPVVDDDAIDETVVVTLSATAGYEAGDETVSVGVADKDTAALDLDDDADLSVTEDDTTGVAFKVRLATRPSANVSVSFTSSNADVVIDSDADTSGSQTTMTFNQFGQTNAWNEYRTVKLTSSHDDDTDSDSATITVSGAGGDYEGLSATVALAITDDDIPPGNFEISPAGSLTVEEGRSGTLSVSLDAAPIFDVSVVLSKTHAGVSLSPASLTFTASNYSTAQPVMVTAAEDDDAIDESDTITLSATGGLVVGDETVAVSVTDDETAEFDLNTTALTLIEGRQTYFLVRLASRPSADVTMTVAPTGPITVDTDPSEAGDQNALTFVRTDGPNDWNRYRRVVVVANRDEDEDDESFDIALSGVGGDYDGKTASVSVSVADVPPGDIVLVPSGTVSIDEGGSRREIDISLSSAPNAEVRVSVSNTNPDVNLDKESLTFTPSDHSLAQTLTIHAVEDGDGVDDVDTIVLSAFGGLFALPATLEVAIVDDDAPPPPPPPPSGYEGNLVIGPSGPYDIPEGGRLALTVALDAEPDEDVRVTLSSENPDLTVAPGTMTFTPSNWSEPVDVDILVGEDDRAVDDTGRIVFSIPGRILRTIEIAIEDNDAMLVARPAGGIETIEGGTSTFFHLRLTRMPPHDVLVGLRSRNDFISVAPSSLTFTPSNWDSEQEVRVQGKEDLDPFDDYDSVLIEASGGTVHFASVAVSVIDNDEAPQESPDWEVKSKALAIPPTGAHDSATLRVRCDQDTPCKIYLDCSTQAGMVLQGYLPAIPAGATSTLVPGYIQRQIGSNGSWEGRLGCSLRSEDNIGSQVWTRSGDGVLVNNSEVIRSVMDGEEHRADIESIPSPDAFDLSNIRIRCESQTASCLDTVFVCYTDDGERYEAVLGAVARGITRHLQAEELAGLLGHRWPGIGLSCEVRSKGRFTAQILTRTGGGGALVNNSATGTTR